MGLKISINNDSVIAVDTSLFIYFIEKDQNYFTKISTIFEKCNQKNTAFKLVTSTITLIEVLTKPIRDKREDLVKQYEEILLNSDNVYVLTIDALIGRKSAELKAKYSFLRTPDSIQLASAIISGADYFLSNDKKLKSIDEIKCFILDEL